MNGSSTHSPSHASGVGGFILVILPFCAPGFRGCTWFYFFRVSLLSNLLALYRELQVAHTLSPANYTEAFDSSGALRWRASV